MAKVFVGVGSNIDPEKNIIATIKLLKASVTIIGLSTFFRTPPFGDPGAPDFINGEVMIETDIAPINLKFDVLRGIENSLGRVRTEKKCSPRTIDLDIMVYGNAIFNEPNLVIPDPEIFTRAFIATPIAELDPDLIVPGSDKCISDIAELLGTDNMCPLEIFTAALRKEIEL